MKQGSVTYRELKTLRIVTRLLGDVSTDSMQDIYMYVVIRKAQKRRLNVVFLRMEAVTSN